MASPITYVDYCTGVVQATAVMFTSFYALDYLHPIGGAFDRFMKKQTNKSGSPLSEEEIRAKRSQLYIKIVSMAHCLYTSYQFFHVISKCPEFYELFSRIILNLDKDAITSKEMLDKIWFTSHDSIYHATQVLLGFFLYELTIVHKWEHYSRVMILHHVLPLIFIPVAAVERRGHWILNMLLTHEMSTPFLCIKGILDTFKVKKNNPIYSLNGLLLTFTFLGIRCGGAIGMLSAVLYDPSYWKDPIIAFLLPSVLAPPFFNVFWGFKLIRGIINILLGKKKEKKVDNKKE
mmetsp:Transcript_4667/g.5282  ORF Transcript_4667/g.5282 Transcript_4667/m.5282 type:complete len:290 (-) Transcript_4667:152-1021(-)